MQIESLIERIKEKKPKRILLQLPDGLKTKASEIVDEIERSGIDVVLSGDPCYGACDLRINEALTAGCDLIVHIGHSKFYRNIDEKIPVFYFPWEIDMELDSDNLGSGLKEIRERKIGLLTTVQYLDQLNTFSDTLISIGKKPIIGGQILGCWTKNAEKIKDRIDAFLFVGTGEFHPLGLTILGKKIYLFDLEKNELRDMSKEMLVEEKKRAARVENARDAKSFAILVSSKPGQSALAAAEKIKSVLEEKDKKAFIIIMDEINNEKLVGLKVDCFINTACPRLVEDKFSKVMMNLDEVKEILK